ncbi:Ribonuclease H2 subunit A, partial [Glycine soja]
VDVIDPRELSTKMLKKNKINLNEILHSSAMSLIDKVLKMEVLLTEVTRDHALREWVLDETVENMQRFFGFAYLGDPQTKSWLEDHKHHIFGFPSLV